MPVCYLSSSQLDFSVQVINKNQNIKVLYFVKHDRLFIQKLSIFFLEYESGCREVDRLWIKTKYLFRYETILYFSYCNIAAT